MAFDPTQIRDRIRELRRVPARLLVPHPLNYRLHPERERAALQTLLKRIGFAAALLTRELPDGRLQLIDGHMRAEEVGDAEVPVLVTDLTADEAEELLLMGDLLVAMAERDAGAFDELRGKVAFDEEDLDRVLSEFAVPAIDALAESPAHDYGVSKRRDKNFLKLVVSIRHHEIIERTIEHIMREAGCDRGTAFTKICERATARPEGAVAQS